MLCLREIVFLFILGLSSSALAAAGFFRSTLDLQNSNGSATSLTQEDSSNSQGLSQTFEMISPTLKKYWTLSSSLKISKMDSSLLTTKDSKGQDVNWSEQDNRITNVGSAGATFSQGAWSSTLKYGQSLDNGIYQSRSISADANWNLKIGRAHV